MGERPDTTPARRATAAAVRAIGAAACLFAVACAELDDPTTVVDLRVLAARAEPPELFIANFDDPGDVPPVTVSLLVADPAGAGRSISASMVACPYLLDTVTAASGGSASLCTPLPDAVKQRFDVTSTVSGIEHTLSATVTFNETTRALFARAPAADRIYGMAVFTEWRIEAGAGGGTESETALKRIRYTEPRQGDAWVGQAPNRTPVLGNVRFHQGYDDRADTFVGTIETAPGAPVPLPPRGLMLVEPMPDDDAVERDYITPVATSSSDPTPVPATISRERLRFSFFATAGTFSPPNTSSELGPLREPGQSVFTAAEYQAPGPGAARPVDGVVTIWIVTRDERGGVSWLSRQIQLAP